MFKQSDFSRDSFSQLQQNDEFFKPFILYLRDGVLPKSQKLARKLLLEVSAYNIVDNLLFHSRIARSKRTKTLSCYQLALPEVAVKRVL